MRRLGELGSEIERRRGPDPYPRAAGPPPGLEALLHRRDEITQIAARHRARTVHVFGSVARGDARPDSDLDLLVELDEHSGLFQLAAVQHDLEDLLGCRVHVMAATGLLHTDEETKASIELEAIRL